MIMSTSNSKVLGALVEQSWLGSGADKMSQAQIDIAMYKASIK